MQEDASMDDILSSIRRILISGQKKEEKTQVVSSPSESKPIFETVAAVETVSEPIEVLSRESLVQPAQPVLDSEKQEEEPFLLTPAMRVALPQSDSVAEDLSVEKTCSLPVEPASSEETVDLKLSTVVVEKQVEPLIQKWLDDHLPDIVEKVVREEVSRILARVLK